MSQIGLKERGPISNAPSNGPVSEKNLHRILVENKSAIDLI